jgi:hypothetical protein
MAHYDIQASELQIKSTRAVSKNALVRRYGNLRIVVPTARHIAALCDCKYWLNREHGVTELAQILRLSQRGISAGETPSICPSTASVWRPSSGATPALRPTAEITQ